MNTRCETVVQVNDLTKGAASYLLAWYAGHGLYAVIGLQGWNSILPGAPRCWYLTIHGSRCHCCNNLFPRLMPGGDTGLHFGTDCEPCLDALESEQWEMTTAEHWS